ncbi:MAG: cellulase family glycosylhydrolase, partial [Actinomycetota bacterium]|nr:cellulase family glycosylhydrolase [Actinomycetota bacterium]
MPTRRGSQERRQTRAARPPSPEPAAPKEVVPAARPTTAPPRPAGKAPRRNPLFPVGVNYYPLDAETDGWDDWYAHDVEADFATFSAARFSIVRLFLSWKVLEPQVGQYDEAALERFADILSAAREHKLQVLVCFFADDRHAELLDVPWGKRRDPRTDSYLISREVALVQKVVNRFRGESAVLAWDLTNEAFLSGFESEAELESWVGTLREAVREVDTQRPITVSADAETLFRQTGVDSRRALDMCEFVVGHSTSPYRAYAAEGPVNSGPGSYLDSFLLRSSARDLPVLMDDVGVFSLENSPTEEAVQIRLALYSGFMNRASGILLRRYKDLDTERREPYFRDPFEVLVGIADTAGRPKATFAEVESFIKLAARIDLRSYSLVQERTAVVIPSERYRPLPDLAGLYDPRSCLQSYMAAKQAHIPVTVAREGDELDAYSVLIVPSAFRLDD